MTHVAIVGAGIGGLTAYHALRHVGITAELYEAAPALREAGAGISVSANGMQILARLGLADEVLRRGLRIDRMEIHDAATGLLQAIDFAPYVRQFGYGLVGIHRATLHDILATGVAPADLHLGKACTHVRTGEGSAEIAFADGSTVRAPVVVGADGINSAVRRSLFPGSHLRDSVHTSYRAVVPFDLPRHSPQTGQIVWGDGCEFGYVGIGGGRVYWYVSVPPTDDRGQAGDVMAVLRQRVTTFPDPLRTLVMATDEAVLVHTAVRDLAPLKTWHDGNVVLLGDAAHASTPYMGQGAAQAMEDACALAAALARMTMQDAFGSFQRARMRKANMVVRLSRLLGSFATVRHPVLRVARNVLYRTTPEFVRRRQLQQLFRIGT